MARSERRGYATTSQRIAQSGGLVTAYLEGAYGTKGLALVDRVLDDVIRAVSQDHDSAKTPTWVRRGVLGLALGEVRRLDPAALEALLAEWDGPFDEALEWHPGRRRLDVSGEIERQLCTDGWWPMLTRCTLSDEGFGYLCARIGDDTTQLEALATVTTSAERMEKVLALYGDQTMAQAFLYSQHSWLRQEPELWYRVLRASRSEAWAVLGVSRASLGSDWNWEWMSEKWLESLEPEVARSLSEWLGAASQTAHVGVRWNIPLTVDGPEALTRVLLHVRGAAYQLLGDVSGRHEPAELGVTLTRLFGEDAEVARSLLNPATNLAELSDVMARL